MSADQELNLFIRSTFRSIWSLELMLFLLRHRERAWSRAELVAALRGSESVVGQSLEALTAAGLVDVEENGAARFLPAAPDLERQAQATAALYARGPDAVRRTIVSSANAGLAAFANAFRLRKD